MQYSLTIVLIAALASHLVSASYPFNTVDVLNEFPPCAQNCFSPVFAASNVSKADAYQICNNKVFLTPVANCENSTCSSVELQQITSLSAILCGPVGGLESTVITTRYPGIPACANNCTSTALLASGCGPEDVTCACTNALYLNAYGPCVEAICDTADIDAFNAASLATCGPQGGGPYNVSEIGGYLNYTVPGGTAPGVRLLNGSYSSNVMVNTSVASSPSPTPSAYQGAAASLMMTAGTWTCVIVSMVGFMVAML